MDFKFSLKEDATEFSKKIRSCYSRYNRSLGLEVPFGGFPVEEDGDEYKVYIPEDCLFLVED